MGGRVPQILKSDLFHSTPMADWVAFSEGSDSGLCVSGGISCDGSRRSV